MSYGATIDSYADNSVYQGVGGTFETGQEGFGGDYSRGTQKYLSKLGLGSLEEFRSTLEAGSLEDIVNRKKEGRQGLRKVAGVANDIAFKAYGMALRHDDKITQAMQYISEAASEEGKIEGSHAYELMEAAGVNNQASKKVVEELTTGLYRVEGEITRPYAITEGKIGKTVDFANRYLGLGLIGEGLQVYHKEGEGAVDTVLRNSKVSGEVNTALIAGVGATVGAGIAAYSGAGAIGQHLQEGGYETGSTIVDLGLTGLFVTGAVSTGNALFAARAANSLTGTSAKIANRYTKDTARKKNLSRVKGITGVLGTFGLLAGVSSISGCTDLSPQQENPQEDKPSPQNDSPAAGGTSSTQEKYTDLPGGEERAKAPVSEDTSSPRESPGAMATRSTQTTYTDLPGGEETTKAPESEDTSSPRESPGAMATRSTQVTYTDIQQGRDTGESILTSDLVIPYDYLDAAQEEDRLFVSRESGLWNQIQPQAGGDSSTGDALEKRVQLDTYDNQSLVMDGKHDVVHAKIGDKVDDLAEDLDEGETLYAKLWVDGEVEKKEITAQNLREGSIGFETEALEGFSEDSGWYFGFGVEEKECGNFTYISSVSDEQVGKEGYSILEAFADDQQPEKEQKERPEERPEVLDGPSGALYHTAELLPGLPLFFGTESDIDHIELSSYDGEGGHLETEIVRPIDHESGMHLAGILTDYTHNTDKIEDDCKLTVQYGGHVDVTAYGADGKEMDLPHDNFFGRQQDRIEIPGSFEGYLKETRNSNPLNYTHEQISAMHEEGGYADGLKDSVGHPLKSAGYNLANIFKDATVGADQIAQDGTEVENGRVGILEGAANLVSRPFLFLGETFSGDPGEGVRQLGSIFTDTRDIVLGGVHVGENALFFAGDVGQTGTSLATSPIHPEGAHHVHAAIFDDLYQTSVDVATDLTFGEAWFRSHSIDLEKGFTENPGRLVPFLNYTLQERGIDSSLVASKDMCPEDVTLDMLADPYRFGHEGAVIDSVGVTGTRKAIEIVGSLGFDIFLYDLMQDSDDGGGKDDGGSKGDQGEPPDSGGGRPNKPGSGGNPSDIVDGGTPGDVPPEPTPGGSGSTPPTGSGSAPSAGSGAPTQP